MNLNKKNIMAGVIATSVISPMAITISHADENNIQAINIEYRTITANAVNFRTGPSTSYSSMGKLNNGYKVEYIGMNGSWVNVKYNGKVGYVHSDYVSKSSDNSNGSGDTSVKSTKIVTATSLNFRSGPGTSYSKLGNLSKGTEVGVISESNGWAKISYNGKVGYVSSQYLANKTSTPSNPSTDNGDASVKSTKVVNANAVNFRTGPGTSYSKISTLSYNTDIGFISESGGWSKIKYNGKVGYMSSQYLSNKNISTPNNPSSSSADKLIEVAKTLLGKPYVWGAEGPSSFDCSGFTQYVMKKGAGVSIPRVSRDQSKNGQAISKSELRKGDLVFFDTEGSNNGSVSHVAIYMGNDELIHASSGAGKVVISKLTSSYYTNAYVNARRVL
ncbi:MAG: SH3 domain-containing protein [Romboutsia sp.]